MSKGASYAEALAEAQAVGYAEADPGDDVSAATPPPRWRSFARLAFGAPVHLDEVRYEGSRISTATTSPTLASWTSAEARGTAERRGGGLSVHVFPTFLYSGHPLAASPARSTR